MFTVMWLPLPRLRSVQGIREGDNMIDSTGGITNTLSSSDPKVFRVVLNKERYRCGAPVPVGTGATATEGQEAILLFMEDLVRFLMARQLPVSTIRIFDQSAELSAVDVCCTPAIAQDIQTNLPGVVGFCERERSA